MEKESVALESCIRRVRKEMEDRVADCKGILQAMIQCGIRSASHPMMRNIRADRLRIKVERNSMAHHGIWNSELLCAKLNQSSALHAQTFYESKVQSSCSDDCSGGCL